LNDKSIKIDTTSDTEMNSLTTAYKTLLHLVLVASPVAIAITVNLGTCILLDLMSDRTILNSETLQKRNRLKVDFLVSVIFHINKPVKNDTM